MVARLFTVSLVRGIGNVVVRSAYDPAAPYRRFVVHTLWTSCVPRDEVWSSLPRRDDLYVFDEEG